MAGERRPKEAGRSPEAGGSPWREAATEELVLVAATSPRKPAERARFSVLLQVDLVARRSETTTEERIAAAAVEALERALPVTPEPQLTQAAILLFGGVPRLGLLKGPTWRYAAARLFLEEDSISTVSELDRWVQSVATRLEDPRRRQDLYDAFRNGPDLRKAAAHTASVLEGVHHGTLPVAAGPWNIETATDVWVDRIEEVEHLTATTSSGHLAVICGLGGLGKSELAAKVARVLRERHLVTAGWQVNAESESTLIEGFALAARAAGLPVLADPAEEARAFLASLDSGVHRWVILLDNAPDHTTVQGWIPSGASRVLVTSRALNGWPRGTELPLDDLDEEAAVELILGLVPDAAEADAREVARGVGGLPLFLHGARSFVEASNGTLDEYRRCLQGDPLATLAAPISGAASIDRSWGPSIDRLHAEAAQLLAVCAWLDPDRFPDRLLTDERSKAAMGLAGPSGPVARSDLLRAGFIRKVGTDGWRIHRLLQILVRERLDPDCKGLHRAMRACLALWPDDLLAPFNRPIIDDLGPQLTRCLRHVLDDHGPGTNRSEAEVDLVTEAAATAIEYLRTQRSGRGAVLLGTEALPLAEAAAPAHAGRFFLELARTGVRLGDTRSEASRRKLSYLERSLDLLERAGDAGHRRVPGVKALRAEHLIKTDQMAGLEQFETAIDLVRALDPPDPLQHARVLSTAVNAYLRAGWYPRALTAAEEGVAVLDRALAEPHRTRSLLYCQLGSSLRRVGRPVEASVAFERALTEFTESATVDGAVRAAPAYAVRLNDLAFSRLELGYPEEALPLYRDALDISLEVDASPTTLVLRRQALAATLSRLGHFAEAEALFVVVLNDCLAREPARLPIRLRHWGLHHERWALATPHHDDDRRGHLLLAECALRWACEGAKVADIRVEWQPITERELGQVLLSCGRTEEAGQHLDAALAMCTDLFGPMSAETAATLALLALRAETEGDLETAGHLAEQAVAAFEATLGPLADDRDLPLFHAAFRLARIGLDAG